MLLVVTACSALWVIPALHALIIACRALWVIPAMQYFIHVHQLTAVVGHWEYGYRLLLSFA
jgi:hypothetical protein